MYSSDMKLGLKLHRAIPLEHCQVAEQPGGSAEQHAFRVLSGEKCAPCLAVPVPAPPSRMRRLGLRLCRLHRVCCLCRCCLCLCCFLASGHS